MRRRRRNPRPIRLDWGVVGAAARDFVAAVVLFARQALRAGRPGGLRAWGDTYATQVDVDVKVPGRGTDRAVLVARFVEGRDGGGLFPGTGAYGEGVQAKTRAKVKIVFVDVNVNADLLGDEKLLNNNGLQEHLARELERLLGHELTHASEPPRRKEPRKTSRRWPPYAQFAAYANDPREVRAVMNELVSDMRKHHATYRSIHGRNWLEQFLRANFARERVWGVLTPRNRNRILSAVFTAAQDMGLAV